MRHNHPRCNLNSSQLCTAHPLASHQQLRCPEAVKLRHAAHRMGCPAGLETFGVKLPEAAKLFGKKFASGASITKNPMEKDQVEVSQLSARDASSVRGLRKPCLQANVRGLLYLARMATCSLGHTCESLAASITVARTATMQPMRSAAQTHGVGDSMHCIKAFHMFPGGLL